MSAGLCDVSGKSQSVVCLMDALGSVNSGSPHRSNVTFKAETIFLVYVKVLGERKKQAVGELWQDGEGTGTIKQAISLSEYSPQEMKQIDFI